MYKLCQVMCINVNANEYVNIALSTACIQTRMLDDSYVGLYP